MTIGDKITVVAYSVHERLVCVPLHVSYVHSVQLTMHAGTELHPRQFFLYDFEEGTRWIKGHHSEGSPEGQALIVAASLLR